MKTIQVAWIAAAMVAGSTLCHAAEEAEKRYAPAKFHRIPREFGVISNYDSVIATEDGKVLMGASTYTHPAKMMELDLASGAIRERFHVGQIEPQDDLQFVTQSKIHSMFEMDSGGVLYFGTHTGEPESSYENPRQFLGGRFMSYNTRTGELRDYGIGRPRDSLMRVALDEKRGKLYGNTYPRGHFVVCDYRKGVIEDLGKASVASYANPWLMHDGQVYFNSRYDEFSRFDPDRGAFETLPVKLPAIDGVEQELTFRSWLLRSDDRKRLYGIAQPARQLVEWDLTRPPGVIRALGGDIDVHSLVFGADGNTLYLPTWSGDLFKYDRRADTFYNLGILKDDNAIVSGLYGACRAHDGRIVFTGLAGNADGSKAQGYGHTGFWIFDPEDEMKIQKEMWGADAPPPKSRQRNAPSTAGIVNKAIPYGESSIRAFARLGDGSVIAATDGEKSHLVLIDGKMSEDMRDLCALPRGERPSFNGLVQDKGGNIYLGTIGDLATIYGMKKAPDGRIYRVELNAERTRASLKEVVRPFEDDGIYTLAVDPAGERLHGVTFPGTRFFSMALADRKVKGHVVLVANPRPQNEDSTRYNWMQIPLGRQIAFGPDGTAYAGANGTTLYGVPADGAAVSTNRLDALRGGQVDALVAGPDGRLVGGTDRGYLFTFNPATGGVVNLGKPLRQARMRGLCVIGDRVYGVGGEEYGRSQLFSHSSGEGFRHYEIPGVSMFGGDMYSDHFDAILPSADGALWLGGSGRMNHVVKIPAERLGGMEGQK